MVVPAQMQFEARADVNWIEVKRRWEAGESAQKLGREFKVDRTTIGYRVKREGWQRTSDKPAQEIIPPNQQITLAPAVVLPADISPRKGGRPSKFTAETRALLVAARERGASFKDSAIRAGISEDALANYRRNDSDFDMELAAAFQKWLEKQEQNITSAGDRGDWKASAWLLERHPETRSTYRTENQGAGSGGTVFNVQINVPRA